MYKRLILTIVLFILVIIRIIDLKVFKYQEYYNNYLIKSDNTILGPTPIRGKILDTNGKVIVDNKIVNNIIYRKINNNNEIDIAKLLIDKLTLTKEATINELKLFYIENNDTNYLLSEEEINDYRFNKINNNDINKLKIDRINDEINNYTNYDKVLIHTYYLMNKGYIKDNKIIKEDVTDTECANITELNIKGLSCDISWQRVNNYPLLNSIMGTVGIIPIEEEQTYLDKGYTKDDLVGISGIEKYYDDYLRGEKSIYEVNNNNELTLISEEKKGRDLTLSIDIDIEEKSFDILKKYLKESKKMNNTEYYNHAYILVGNPNTGEIISIAGLRLDNNEYKEISINALTSSYTVGSIIKGASHTVGYLNNLIDINKRINDSCVKLKNIPEKCSFKRLGYLNDITALKMSSNYYQFITAIKSTGNNYKNNMELKVTIDDFERYRSVFRLYGLGSATGIDFPKESLGIKGNIIAPDLFLNLAIGQYDNYTPLQLLAYINTIANNGTRLNLSIKKQNNSVISTIPIDDVYLKRIQQGFYEVVNKGTGLGYTDSKYNACGKTGTSESYYDNKTTTITQSYVMYAPINNPKYSLVVVNPNISYNNDYNNYIAPINRLISKEISNYIMEYK